MLNRFSKDIGQMDEMLPNTFYDYARVRLLLLLFIFFKGGDTVIGLSYTASPAFFFFSLSVRCFHIVKLSEIK